MLTCPVCQSQNMETAKFCGNCGTPFPRPSASTSSLVNCAQGHVYSAVYAACPYCPQPANGPVSEFATRVAEPAAPSTAFDAPTALPTLVQDEGFLTYIDRNDATSVIAAPVSAADSASTAANATIVTAAPAFEATEVFPLPAYHAQEREDAVEQAPASFVTVVAPEMNGNYKDDKATNPSFTTTAPAPPAPPPVARPATPVPPAPTAAAPAAPTEVYEAPPEVVHRTTVITEAPGTPIAKGRIVGWLITYSHDPDGQDFRLHAGYNRIGANPVCDIVIDDETVSGSHAIIVYRDGKCLIKDDLSRNGTYVNGREIGEAFPLQSYDQVRIGNTYLTYVAAQKAL